MYSIQGLKTVGNSLPKALGKILKKGGHNYSSIINNWTEMVGKKTSEICYPKSVKTNKELKDGTLVLNVSHGNQLDVEYSKQDIIDKINAFFGYQFVKELRLVLVREKVEIKKRHDLDKNKISKYHRKIENIESSKLKKNLEGLISAFGKKKI